MFHHLTISDLHLGLDEMFERRLTALRSTGIGRSYEPRLAWYRGQLVDVGRPVDPSRPLADRLALTSSTHNALGAAIHHMMEAHLRVPGRGEEERRTIIRLRRAFMPRLGELQDSYATQAARATARREQLEAHMTDLSAFPVRGDQTLAHWVRAYIEQGCMLGALLACRADVTAHARASDKLDGGLLRSTLIGLLGRLRAAVADELALEPERHRQLDAELFAYLDHLAKTRDVASRARLSHAELDRVPAAVDAGNEGVSAPPAAA